MTVIFYISAVLAVVAAILTITRANAVHSLLYFICSLLATAVMFFVLGAPFVAALVVIINAGAIMVLFIFVIMLLNAGAEGRRGRSFMVQLLGVPLLIALLGLLVYFVQRFFPTAMVHFGGFTGGSAASVGRALFSTYLLPFEVTSVLILIAILGAIVLAQKEMD